jgi:hypothetical protein
MWTVAGKIEDPNWLIFKPTIVLYAYDGPRTFICKDMANETYLAHWCDEDDERTRFLIVPFSQSLLSALISGEIDVRDALTRNMAWIFDLNNDWNPVQAWSVEISDLPNGILPRPGVMLWNNLRPVTKLVTTRSEA